nr:hypothetical protein [Tanacetum cinerariifolium]
MRLLVSREIRTPSPHMRPLARSGVRSSSSPMRPFNPLISSSNSQPLNSTSSVQPMPPPYKRFLVPQPRSESPHASVATSAHSSLPCGPSVPQSEGPRDKLNDNVKTLTYNAALALNILKTPEFPRGGNGAQPPSAHELVYLSDDDLMAKQKDAPLSVITRSRRKTSTGKQASTNPLNTQKSPRFEKQMSPTPSTVKEKPHKSDKQMGSTPLRRCERGKNHVDVHASNVKSREKSVVISEEGSRDSNGGSKNRKRYHAVEFKAQKSPRFQESRE